MNNDNKDKVIILGGGSGLGREGVATLVSHVLAACPTGMDIAVEIVDQSTGRTNELQAELSIGNSYKGIQFSPYAFGYKPKDEKPIDGKRKNFRKSISKSNDQIKKDAMARTREKRLEKERIKGEIAAKAALEAESVSNSELVEKATPQANTAMKQLLERACENYKQTVGDQPHE